MEISSQIHFEDSLGERFDRQGIREHVLKNEEEIARYAKDNDTLRQKLLNSLHAWQARRAPRQQAVEVAELDARDFDRNWQKAISRHDAVLLRLLLTPSPSLSELTWKVQTLREENCSDEAEQSGWEFVVREMALMAGGKVEPLMEQI